MIGERTFTWKGSKRTADVRRDMTDLDLMTGVRDARVFPPPIVALVGMSPAEADEGRVVIRSAMPGTGCVRPPARHTWCSIHRWPEEAY